MQKNLIVFEGGEGSGKSEKSKYVVEQLNARGVKALWTREPGGSPFAELIRGLILHPEYARSADAETMFGLFWAARRDHFRHTIIPALEKGLVVVSDRLDGSTFAYQIGGQEQPQLKKLFWMMREHYIGGHAPGHYVFCDIEPYIGLARAKGRRGEKTHFDDREIEFHERVRDGFREFFASPGITHSVLDANVPFDEAKQQSLALVEKLLA